MNALTGKSILVVDPDPSTREAISQAFQLSGATVLSSNTGDGALDAMKTRKVDVFFASLETMGEQYEILRHLSETLKTKALLFLSYSEGHYSIEALKKMGVCEVFKKPLTLDQIVKVVREEIEKHAVPTTQAAPASQVTLEKVSFLVVQENVAQIEIVSQILSTEYPNASIIGAMNPKSGLQNLARQRFDLVISDLHLGSHNGINFIRAASSDESLGGNLKFILTGDGADPEELKGLPPGVIYCPKPIQQKFFLESVKKLVVIHPREGISPSTKIEVEFINLFVDAALKVFDALAGVAPVKDVIFLRQPDQPSGDISGVMELNSDRFYGSIAISFEKDTFLQIISRVHGKPYPEVSPEIQDGVADICRQVYENAKAALQAKGYGLSPTVPSIQVGKGHSVKHTARGACIGIRFSTEFGPFTVEAVLEPRLVPTHR